MIVVLVQDTSLRPDLSYRVGSVRKEAGEVEWGTVRVYDRGQYPSVSLINIEDVLYVIETHLGFVNFRYCYYKIGKVNTRDKNIEWIRSDSIFFCKGKNAKVSANDNGTVTVVTEENLSWGDYLHLYVGKIDTQNMTITWVSSDSVIQDMQGVEPDVSINGQTIVVACCARGTGRIIQFRKGTINNDLSVGWNGVVSELKASGASPSISLNSDGNIVEVHQAKNWPWKELSFCCGHIKDDHSILWGESRIHTSGQYPSISLSDDGYIFEMHRSGNDLKHMQGDLKNEKK